MNMSVKGRRISALRSAHRVRVTLTVTKHWSAESQRVIGHIAYSPPISIGTGATGFAEDWALVELDNEKIDWRTFRGNVVDLGMFWSISSWCIVEPAYLGTKISLGSFSVKMYPNPLDPNSFKYPVDRLLPLQDIMEDDELRRPDRRRPDGTYRRYAERRNGPGRRPRRDVRDTVLLAIR